MIRDILSKLAWFAAGFLLFQGATASMRLATSAGSGWRLYFFGLLGLLMLMIVAAILMIAALMLFIRGANWALEKIIIWKARRAKDAEEVSI